MARPKVSLSSLLDEVPEVPAVETPPAEPPKALTLAPLPAQNEPVISADGAPVAADPNPVSTVPVPAEEPVEDTDADHTGGGAPSAPEQVAAKPAGVVQSELSKRSASPVRAIKAAPEPPPLPLYLELTRKEARFRQDQLNDLTTLTRQLNRRRGSTGERITDNTLIRVAVDMMLKVADTLDGATESELLDAVSARLKR